MINQENNNLMQNRMFSIESEQSVIGSLMLNNDCFDDVSQVVQAGDFFHMAHRSIFQAVVNLAEAGRPFDPVTVSELLKMSNDLESCGGIQYLIDVVESVPSTVNAVHYAGIVKDKSNLRAVHSVADRIRELANDCQDSRSLIADVQEVAFSLTETSGGGTGEAVAGVDVLREVIQRIQRQMGGEDSAGYMTGLEDFDARTNGLQGSNLIILAARPSMGKSMTAMNWAVAGLERGDTVFVFSLEDAKASFMKRALSRVSGVEYSKIKKPSEASADRKTVVSRLNDDDLQKISVAASKMKKWPLFIDDTAGLTAGEIVSRARRMARKNGSPKLIIIDHLKYVKFAGKNLVNEIGEATKQFKTLSKAFNCPVVLLCQLSRGVESRLDKRPLMSDLRDSGEIEQDGDVIVCLYRDEVYNEDSDQKGVLEMIIRKGRDIQIGTDKCCADLKTMSLKNFSPQAFYSQQDHR